MPLREMSIAKEDRSHISPKFRKDLGGQLGVKLGHVDHLGREIRKCHFSFGNATVFAAGRQYTVLSRQILRLSLKTTTSN